MVSRARRQWQRAREEGLELPELLSHNLALAGASLRRHRFGLFHDCSPHAVPVFLTGIQRSGTTMLQECLNDCPEVEVFREGDGRAFEHYQLRSDPVIRELVRASRQRCVVFKALCDAHRVAELMERLGTPSAGRTLWIYRSMIGRVRSTIAKWPENNHRVLRTIAAGDAAGMWEAGGLTEEKLDLVRSFDYDAMSRESAAALLWYLRNGLFFDLRLDRRGDTLLTSYDRFLAEPERLMRPICEFLSVPFSDRMIASISPRPPKSAGTLPLDPRITSLCEELESRLDATLSSRLEGWAAGVGGRVETPVSAGHR